MPFKERRKILLGLKAVDKVVKCIDKDETVKETLKDLRKKNLIDVFANVDRDKRYSEYEVCKENGIKMVFELRRENTIKLKIE